MSLASILLTLEEDDYQNARRLAVDTSSRHLASAGKWGKGAAASLARFQRTIRRRAVPPARRAVNFPVADLRAALGL